MILNESNILSLNFFDNLFITMFLLLKKRDRFFKRYIFL